MRMQGRVLVVAGSDSGGGAGIQADVKAVTALGGFAATAITALTAQNTQGVFGIHAVPPDFIRQQMRLVLEDIGADCVKCGMLHAAPVIEAVAEVLDEYPDLPVVLDPVMVAKGGASLLEAEAVAAYRERILPRATLLTPNAPEAEVLTGVVIRDAADMEAAIGPLRALGAKAVLLKGGHVPGATVRDLLVTADRVQVFEGPRIETRHTHGTGCTLASAIAAGIARGLDLPDAVGRAITYVQEAIRTAPGFGRGHGPLNHAHTVRES